MSITTQPGFAFGNARPVPSAGASIGSFIIPREVDPLPDGQHMLALLAGASGEAGTRPQIQVVLNWFEELKARVPTK